MFISIHLLLVWLWFWHIFYKGKHTTQPRPQSVHRSPKVWLEMLWWCVAPRWGLTTIYRHSKSWTDHCESPDSPEHKAMTQVTTAAERLGVYNEEPWISGIEENDFTSQLGSCLLPLLLSRMVVSRCDFKKLPVPNEVPLDLRALQKWFRFGDSGSTVSRLPRYTSSFSLF